MPKGSNSSKLLNAQKLELLNVRIAQMLDLLNAQSPQENAQKTLCLVKIQNSKFKIHLITFSTSSMFLSNGPLCSSFSVHMAAANLPASVMLSPCERQ